MRKTLQTIGAIMLVVLASCSEQTSIEPSTPLVLADYSTEADLLAIDLGKRIAKLLEDEKFRDFVGYELKKQFDGDDNFLILKAEQNAKNANRLGGSFLEMLYPKENTSGRSAGNNDLVKNLEENYPLLQLAFPDLDVGDVNDWLANPKGLLQNKVYRIGEVILFANKAKSTHIAPLWGVFLTQLADKRIKQNV